MEPDPGSTDAAVDELTALVLDTLGPVFAMYRREVARRVGLGPDELTCLDQLRRLGPSPASVVGRWVGVERSPLSRFLRRLEVGGHLERHLPTRRGQEVDVAVHVADMLARHTQCLLDDVAHERFLARRRREHAAMPDFRWWER